MKVLVREPIAEPGIQLLRDRGFDVDVQANGDLADLIGGYEGIVIRSATKLTADLIARADRLKVIGRAGVGIDNVDVDAATRRGIVVANAPESTVVSAAEHTIGLLVAETRGAVGAGAFAKMRDGVRLVNAARGELIDENALVDALQSGKVAAAALDVFSKEPYSGPLLEHDNVVVTPHLAASTDEAQDRAGVIIAEQVAAALEGGLVSNAVNIPAIGPDDLEVLGPYVPLAASLRKLAMDLALGRP